MVTLNLTTVGKSTGFIVPKQVLNRMKLKKGDTVFLTGTGDGYLLIPYNPEFETQMERASQ
jgi:antitoxin component of MazEF toxin-antitoxin module